MGLPAIANQTFRLIAHARLHQAVEQWQEKYPGVDIILVEPEPNDELMFGTPIMDYSRRLQIARHGFESVTATLAQDYERFKEIAERHGLEISGPPRPPRGRAGRRGGARADLGLAPRARADDLGAAAADRRGVLARGGWRGRPRRPPPRELRSHALRLRSQSLERGSPPRRHRIAFRRFRDIPGEGIDVLPRRAASG